MRSKSVIHRGSGFADPSKQFPKQSIESFGLTFQNSGSSIRHHKLCLHAQPAGSVQSRGGTLVNCVLPTNDGRLAATLFECTTQPTKLYWSLSMSCAISMKMPTPTWVFRVGVVMKVLHPHQTNQNHIRVNLSLRALHHLRSHPFHLNRLHTEVHLHHLVFHLAHHRMLLHQLHRLPGRHQASQ